jgi:hypothetical protein
MEYKYEGTGDFEGLVIESALPKEYWKFGTELLVYSNQPERSKREDSWYDEMRCSEHDRNIVRDK